MCENNIKLENFYFYYDLFTFYDGGLNVFCVNGDYVKCALVCINTNAALV